MKKKLKIIGIVPAKTPSTRLPNKNTKKFCRKSLISYSFELLLSVDQINTIVCLTNDSSVKEIAGDYNIDIIDEPEHLLQAKECGELASYVLTQRKDFDVVILTHPTFPMRTKRDILEAINLINEGFDSAIGISEIPHIQWSGTLNNKVFKLDNVNDFRTPTQNLEKKYIINTAVFASTKENIVDSKTFINGKIGGVLVPQYRNIDINNKEDFDTAEKLFKLYKGW